MFARPVFPKNKQAEKSEKKAKKSITNRSYLNEPEDEGIPDHQYLPETKERWHLDPSAKIDHLREIIDHHLREDNGLPIIGFDSLGAIYGSEEDIAPAARIPRTPGLQCDKILVYSAFPLNNDLIIHVLGLFGHHAVEINGSMTAKARSTALHNFKNSTFENGPRILIVSNVGTIGLNIPEANILIQMVSSARIFNLMNYLITNLF